MEIQAQTEHNLLKGTVELGKLELEEKGENREREDREAANRENMLRGKQKSKEQKLRGRNILKGKEEGDFKRRKSWLKRKEGVSCEKLKERHSCRTRDNDLVKKIRLQGLCHWFQSVTANLSVVTS